MKSNLFKIVSIMIFTVSIANASSTYWLGTNAQTDGSLQSQNVAPIATDFQATATSIETFIYFGDTTSTLVTNGLDYLLANHNNSTEQLARIIQIQAQVSTIDQVFVDDLLSRINTDGGIGEDVGFSSNVLDSAWALLAFSAAGNVNQQVLEDMITFIKSRVNTDYGYSNFESNYSSVYVSSVVNLAFNKYRNIFTTLNTDINQINQFIVNQQLIEGGWGEIHKTAIALIALTSTNYAPSTYWLSVLNLRNSKSSTSFYNYQWLEEVYTTALALVAEGLTDGMSAPTSSGSVIGHVNDSSTLQALNGAKVTLDGLSYKIDYTDSLGIFNFSNISNAVHSLEINYPGYITDTISFEIIGGNNLNIGEIQLIKNPDTALIKGIVTDGETGLPYNGASINISADTTYTTQTDIQGRYQIEVQPGNFEITASAGQRDTVYAQSNILAGQTLEFSPTLYTNGIGLSQAKLLGHLVDKDNNNDIENAQINISVNNTDYFSDSNGVFVISGLELGSTELTIQATGYHTMNVSLLLSGGDVNLGNLALIPINQATTSTVFGTVKDGNIPLTGVTVAIVGTDLSTLTDSDGTYSIAEIPSTSYQVTFSNSGYETLFFDISSQQHSSSELNVVLDSLGASPLKILEFLPEQFEYQGLKEIEFDIELFNNTFYFETKTRLYLRVRNSKDEIISYYPLKTIPFNGILDDALEILGANQTISLKASWGTNFNEPGEYKVDLLAFDENSEELLTQASTTVTLLSIKALEGSINFNPEITNFNPLTPIQIIADIKNVGSEPIGTVQVTADVYLTDKENNSTQTTGKRINEYSDSLLNLPRLMKKNSQNDIIIYNAVSGDFVKFKFDGSFQSMFNIRGVGDFSLNSLDQILTIDGYCRINKYDEFGVLLQHYTTGLRECRSRSIEVIDDDNVYIVSDSGIHNLQLSTGTLTEVVGNYLQNPQGMIKHSDGRIIVADGALNSLLVYENNKLSKWATNLSNPHGLCEDIDGSVLVANYGSNEIIRVQNDGSSVVVTNSIPAPFDIKLNPVGGYFVSSETENKLYQLNSDGSFNVIYNSFINVPKIIVSGNNSDIYIYNSGNKEIIHKLEDGTVTTVAVVSNSIYSMVVDLNDNLIVSMSDNLFRLEADSSFTALSSTNLNVSMIEVTDVVNELLITSGNGEIKLFNTITNLVEEYIQSPFGSIISAQTDTNNLTYLLDSSGKLTTVDQNMNYRVILSGLGTTKDIFISSSDEIFIARADKTIIKLDGALNIIPIATLSNTPDRFVINALGEVIYSDKSKNLYINDGNSESIYTTLNEFVYGDLAIDNNDTLLITYNSNSITQIFSNLTVNTIALDQTTTGIYQPRSIAMNYTSGKAWVSYRGGVFQIDSLGVISDIHSSAKLSTTNLAVTSNSFLAAGGNNILQFDLNLNYQNTYGNFSQLYDMAKQANGDLILAVHKPYDGLIKYTNPNKLPEFINYGRYYEINKSQDDNHILALTYNKILDFDLINNTQKELADVNGELTKITQIDNNFIHVAEYSKNRYSVYDFSGNSLSRVYGLNRLQGLAVDNNSTLYLTDAVNIYKLNQDNSIEIAYPSLPGNYMDIYDGVIYKSYLTNGSLYKINLNTQEREMQSMPTTQISSIVYDGLNNIVVGPSGLFESNINGEVEVLINSVDRVSDVIKMENGEIFLTINSDITGLASILQLKNGFINSYRNLSELHNIRVNYLTEDNGVLYAYSDTDQNPSIIVVNSENTKILRPFSILGGINSILVNGNYLYGLTDENIVYQSEIIDKSQDTPLIGDIVHTSTMTIDGDTDNLQLSFAPFIAPIAGDYHVKLSFSDVDIHANFANSLHVGNIATGFIQLSENNIAPGDSLLGTNTFLEGLDVSGFTDIIEKEEELIYDYDGSFYDMTNFIVVNQAVYYLSNSSKTVKKFDRNTGIESEFYVSPEVIVQLLKDNDNNIVLLGGSSNPTKWLDLEGNLLFEKNFNGLFSITSVKTGDFDSSNQLVVLGKLQSENDYSVFQINIQNDSFVKVRNNVSLQDNLSVAGDNNIYLLGTSIFKLDVIKDSIELLKEGIGKEGESKRNALTVCEDTPIFTDFTASFSEESEIYSINGDILYDSINEDLYPGESYSKLADFETLYYDKDFDTLYLFNHHWYTQGTTGRGNHGDIISIPVNCGKMFVELHLTDQSNTGLSGFDIPPNQTIEVGPNTYEYVWVIDGLDEVQKIFNFQTQVTDLLPNESRPILSSAYLKFKNGLNPQQDLVVNIDIPSVLGVIDRTLNVSLDNTQYSSNTDIQIANKVNNTASIDFNGSIVQQIEDAQGNLVTALAPLNITNLAASTSLNYPEVWNTSNYYAGDYTLVSKLYDDLGNLQDEKTSAFSIIPSAVNNTTASLRVLTNKVQYTSYDLVEISPSVSNLSNNNILTNHTAQLLVTAPNGMVIFQQTTAINNLSTNAIQNWQHQLPLNNAPLGLYAISLNLIDENGVIVANETTGFEVILDEQQVLSGLVVTAFTNIQPGTDNTCHYELTNSSNQAINTIEVHQTVVNLSNQLTMQDDVVTINLDAGATWSNQQNIPTSQLSSGDHACVLRTIINADDTTQASSIFFVQGANQILGTIWSDEDANGIFDTTETGIAGVQISLLDQTMVTLQTVSTDADGAYNFAPVFNGEYTVSVEESGTLSTYAITSNNNPTTLNVVNNHSSTDFGYQQQIQYGAIEGVVFDDIDGDGIQSTGELGIANITLDLSSSTQSFSAITDANGQYQFNQLIADDYTTTVTDNNGLLTYYQLTTANQPYVLTVTENEINNTGVFGYQAHLSVISGSVIKDDNGNGILDNTEVGYANVTVDLMGVNSTAQVSTNSTGIYEFTGLTTGEYSIAVSDQNNILLNNQLTSASSSYQVSLGTNQTNDSGLFAYQLQNSGISGLVFNDTNGNGIQDNGETGLTDITMDLIQDNNVISTYTTDVTGVYQFNQLVAGSYQVVITDTNNLLTQTQTTTNNQPFNITLAENENLELVSFGYQYHNSGVLGIVFEDTNGNAIQDNGETGITGVTIDLVQNNNVITSAITTTDGSYQFNQQIAGTYQVLITDTVLLLADLTITTNNQPLNIDLIENQTIESTNFGYRPQLADITGVVFKDDNGNGIQDNGEIGYANVTLELSDGNVITAATTDGLGNYQFNGLIAGDYTTTITDTNSVLINTVLTSANQPYSVTLIAGQADTTGNFAYQLQNSGVSGLVYNDSNGNGVLDTGETGLTGITIDLIQDGNVISTLTTDITGVYQFNQLVTGDYQVLITDTNNVLSQTQTTTNNQPFNITLAENENLELVSFGYQYHNSGVLGIVFEDTNGNAIQDNGETGITEVTIDLVQNNNVITSAITTADGSYQFNQQIAGTYQVLITDTALLLADLTITTNNQPLNIDLIENQTIESTNFGYQPQLADITGVVFKDDNGNGIQDNGEIGYANVTLELSDGNVITAATTDGLGNYQFSDLLAGDYTTTITDTNNILANTVLTSANQPYSVTLIAGQADTTGNFAYQLQNSGISGLVFNDTNGNGIQDNGETGLPDITMDLIQDNNVISTYTTDATGVYQFNQLVAGSYQVVITDTNNLLTQTQTTTNNQPFNVTLAENENLELVSFGYQYHNATVSGIVFDDSNENGVYDAGEPYLENIDVELKDDSTQITSTIQTDVNGAYEFTQLATQSYTLSITDNDLNTAWQNTSNNNPTSLTLIKNDVQTLNFGFVEIDTTEIEIEASILETDGRGRILILLDQPGNFIDENTCGGLHDWSVEAQIDSEIELTPDTIITARLFASNGDLLETEEVLYSTFEELSDLVAEHNNANLIITAINNNSISLQVTADNTDEYATLNDDYYVELQIENTATSQNWISDTVLASCNTNQDVGQASGDFAISELIAAPKALTDEPFGPELAPTLAQQRTYLKVLLDQAGWSYTITENAQAFQEQFHTGQYVAYAIFSEKVKLPTAFQYEVTDAFAAGEGLIVATGHDLRNQKLYAPLGVKIQGKHPSAQTIQLDESPLHSQTEEDLNLDEVVLKVKMVGATSVGIFTGTTGNASTKNAISYTTYGAGKGVFGALDLLIQATHLESLSVYSELILNSIAYVHNEVIAAQIGKAQLLKLQISNIGVAFTGTIEFDLPQHMSLANIDGDYAQVDDHIQIAFNVDEDQILEINIWLVLDESPQTLSVEILDSTQQLLETLNTTLTATQVQ